MPKTRSLQAVTATLLVALLGGCGGPAAPAPGTRAEGEALGARSGGSLESLLQQGYGTGAVLGRGRISHHVAAQAPAGADRPAPGEAGALPAGNIEQAASIAARILGQNARAVRVKGFPDERRVLLAGAGHFDALWARDACFAAFGAIELGQLEAVKGSLETLIDMQRQDGLMPRRVGQGQNRWGIVKAALGFKPKSNGEFDTAEYRGLSGAPLDTNPLVVWLASEYVGRSGDSAFARRHLERLERAVSWLEARADGGLLVQGKYEDWKDLTKRTGKVLYTNVLYCRAVRALSELATVCGDEAKARDYAERADRLAGIIRQAFWDPERGYFHDTTTLDVFSADGNFLAIVTGVATEAQGRQVLDAADQRLLRPWGWYAGVDRPYPSSMVPAYLGLFGMRGYGDDTFNMSLITSYYAIAASRLGQPERAERALLAIAATTQRDGTFEEVYEADRPQPVIRRFYRSERDFTWSAGMFLRARAELARATRG